ncbi:MAG: alpha-L-fucosidase [Bacteroidota bacterium]
MLRAFFLFTCLLYVAMPLLAQPKPTEAQQSWHRLEYYWFAHFGPNTFTGAEWGTGKEKAEIFQPDSFDPRQWCRLAQQAGARGIIITAKHHDGFCLWPSRYSTHTIRESGWRNGKGDVLKELSQACQEYGLKFGVYLSPWDRNHPDYGTAAYNQVFANMLREVLTQYGSVWELWWDGANGEGPNGKKQVYDWDLFRKTVRELSPQTVVFSDVGPDIRWVGNEKGIAGETNWNTLNIDGFTAGEGAPPTDTLNRGNVNGANWIPAECDVSIRPGWIWRRSEDSLVKSPQTLFDLYLKSVGRGANLLLNVPPNDHGLISAADSISLVGFAALRANQFNHELIRQENGSFSRVNGYVSSPVQEWMDSNATNCAELLPGSRGSIRIDFDHTVMVNALVLEEELSGGQHCARFEVELIGTHGFPYPRIEGTTIGNKRIITFPAKKIREIRLRILKGTGPVRIRKPSVYRFKD